MRKIFLNPVDGRKSFYHKAYVIKNKDGSSELFSYGTLVAKYSPIHGFSRIWNDYSATTMRHVNAYTAYLGMNVGGKAWWNSLKVEAL